MDALCNKLNDERSLSGIGIKQGVRQNQLGPLLRKADGFFFGAVRSVNLFRANWDFIGGDLTALAVGAIVTCVGAAYLLRVAEE